MSPPARNVIRNQQFSTGDEGISGWTNKLQIWEDHFNDLKAIVDGMNPCELQTSSLAFRTLAEAMNDTLDLLSDVAGKLAKNWGGQDAQAAVAQMNKAYQQALEIQNKSQQVAKATAEHADKQTEWKQAYGTGSPTDSWVRKVARWATLPAALGGPTSPAAVTSFLANNMGAEDALNKINQGTRQSNESYPPEIKVDMPDPQVTPFDAAPASPGAGGGAPMPSMPGGGAGGGGAGNPPGSPGLPGPGGDAGPGGGAPNPFRDGGVPGPYPLGDPPGGGFGGPGYPGPGGGGSGYSGGGGSGSDLAGLQPGNPGTPGPGGGFGGGNGLPGGPNGPGGPPGGPSGLLPGGPGGLPGGLPGGRGGGLPGGRGGGLPGGKPGGLPGGIGGGSPRGFNGVLGGPNAAGRTGVGAGPGGMGMGMPMGAGAGHGGREEERERAFWLPEDEEFWNNDQEATPPVIG
ncbi:hypothetical protein [Thermomonospora sp. CIF 1]|uniref:WXG100 family type VII secretion target n=1 Tax=Thermomonospora sp. CIF 1 TaxID=1916083 RepID=UPI002579ECBC|nr:hypothetical protein [Thermomonospora sp. CIF 1]